MIADALIASLDPTVMARQIGISPDPWQAEALTTEDSRTILLCSRQAGKSLVASLRAIHTILFDPGSLVITLAPSLRQSGELFRTALGIYHRLGRPVAATSETALTLTLANGSRLLSLPSTEATIRGLSGASLLICDEASRIPDATYFAVRPMLAVSGGRLMLMSTPWGKRGFFHHEWTEGGDAWRRFRVPADECPRITPEFLEEERRAMPLITFEQEYMTIFGEMDGSVWEYDLIRGALDPTVTPIWS